MFDFRNRVSAYIEPLWYLAVAFYGAVIAVCRLAFNEPAGLFNASKIKDAVFAEFWLRTGPLMAAEEQESAVPKLVSEARGIVLELGPGIGSQLPRFDKSKISKVYGVEPNLGLHESLRVSVEKAGLVGTYEIVACSIEEAEKLQKKYGIGPESIDTVLSTQVLCSISDPTNTIRRLHALLKPGGQFIVYEHVKSQDLLSSAVQALYSLVWPFFVGNCHLNCDTLYYLIQSGHWGKVELTLPTAENAWQLFPRIYGRMWKI